MNKQVLRLTESELIKLIKVIVSEQTQIVTDFDRAFDYKKEGNKFYFKGKGSFANKYPDWTEPLSDKALEAIKTKVFKINKYSVDEPSKIDKSKKETLKKTNKKVSDTTKNYISGPKNIIIGDSQTPYIDNASVKASKIGEQGSEDTLWKGGMGLSWLKKAVEKYPISPDVNSVTINIGTNGGFNPNDDVEGLVSEVRRKFPNAKILAVQGSWKWKVKKGGNQNVTQEMVDRYYNMFRNVGVTVLNTAIGKVDNPHGNIPIYKKIGAELDSLI